MSCNLKFIALVCVVIVLLSNADAWRRRRDDPSLVTKWEKRDPALRSLADSNPLLRKAIQLKTEYDEMIPKYKAMKSKMESMQADYAILKLQIQEDQEASNKAYVQTDDDINKARDDYEYEEFELSNPV